jgi:methyl acetate hydrolase
MRKRHRISIPTVALLCAALGTACAQDSGAIDTYLEQAVAETGIPGIVAAVTDADGVVYSGAFGYRDVANGVEMTTDSIFRIASMTKPVTSVAVQMLIEDGRIGLDDPVSKYLPEFAGKEVVDKFNPADGSYTTRPAKSEITIRELLTHTSGIGYPFSNDILASLEATGADVSAQAAPLLFDPGTRWAYGASTRVLGYLVETVSGQSLDDFMAERIFAPLGMTETSYVVPAAETSRVVTVHQRTPEGFVEGANPTEVRSPDNGDGGLNSTAADYLKFVRMFLNGGRADDGTRILSEASVRQMGTSHTGNVKVELQPAAQPERTRPFPLGAGRDTFGLGFQLTGGHDDEGLRAPGSMSWAGIFNTEFWIDPERGLGAVLLMQYLPFYDDAAIETLEGFERRVNESFD